MSCFIETSGLLCYDKRWQSFTPQILLVRRTSQ